ncbi:MAG: hypothetical protein PUC65_05510 [Clostridiales bacterium]|nr:hypothetical protein [Clostridiales bacterium]
MKKRVFSLLFTVTLLVSIFTGCSSKQKASDIEPTPIENPTIEPKISEPPQISEEPKITIEPEPTTEPEKEKQEEYPIEIIEAAGAIDGVTYTNSKIGFSISVPESWLIFGTEDTYDYIAKSLGYSEDKIPALKEEVRVKGVTYLFYGNDTQLSKNGNKDRLTAEAINIELFQGSEIEAIIKMLSKASVDQYSAKGGECKVSDPIKITVGEQDIYQVPTTVTYDVTRGDTVSKQVISLVNIIFERADTVVYMILSTDLEDSDKLVKTIIETLSFNN